MPVRGSSSAHRRGRRPSTEGGKVADLPTDAASAVGKSSLTDRSPSGRLVGSEGKRVWIRRRAGHHRRRRRPDVGPRRTRAGRGTGPPGGS
ncbi:MAG: hypothetical protein ACR2JM_05120 [Mycobacterium sp.]